MCIDEILTSGTVTLSARHPCHTLALTPTSGASTPAPSFRPLGQQSGSLNLGFRCLGKPEKASLSTSTRAVA